MTDETKDVKPEEEQPQSDTSADETTDDTLDKEPESEPEESVPGEPLTETEVKTEESEKVEEEPVAEEPAEDKEILIEKKDEEIDNLKKALREEHSKSRKISGATSLPARQPATPVKEDTLSQKLIEANERQALKTLYKEYPDLSPENDSDNELFNRFQRGYKVLVESDKVLPLTADEILEKGREVMRILKPSSKPSYEKEEKKAEMANLGKPSSGKRREVSKATSSDVKAAKLVGMSVEEYMKNKDTFVSGDEVPI